MNMIQKKHIEEMVFPFWLHFHVPCEPREVLTERFVMEDPSKLKY